DKATIDQQIKTRQIKVYVYNSQNATPDIQAQVDEARTAGIPVTTITETLIPAGGGVQQRSTGVVADEEPVHRHEVALPGHRPQRISALEPYTWNSSGGSGLTIGPGVGSAYAGAASSAEPPATNDSPAVSRARSRRVKPARPPGRRATGPAGHRRSRVRPTDHDGPSWLRSPAQPVTGRRRYPTA